MSESLRDQAWRFICAAFPERQIYIRSDGRVQFFTFGPLMQAILAGITLLFLGWVAFTSVNVVFKDRIIATKERHYQQMQSSYENRVADLQLSYDQLNGALISTEDHFKGELSELETKHQILAGLIRRKEALRAAVAAAAAEMPATTSAVPEDLGLDAEEAPGSPSDATEGGDVSFAPASASSIGTVSRAPEPLVSKPAATSQPAQKPIQIPGKTGFLKGAVGAVEKITTAIFTRNSAAPHMDHPVIKKLAAEEYRVDQLVTQQRAIAEAAQADVAAQIDDLEKALRMTGVDPSQLVSDVHKEAGMGGPLMAMPSTGIESDDPVFYRSVVKLTDSVDELDSVATALRTIPLNRPVGADYSITSGFGARVDPFTKRLAFHAGLDFAGPAGANVHATAPGIVVYAGARGGYGNAVEIDHGYGIRTRYGHLRSISVAVGTEVKRGDVVGLLGSTGRSTGPHVHYEIWYDDKVRNPYNFLKAGKYVLAE